MTKAEKKETEAKRLALKAYCLVEDRVRNSAFEEFVGLFEKAIEYGRTLPERFTDKKPTESGYYWYMNERGDKPILVKVDPELYFYAYDRDGVLPIGLVNHTPGKFSLRLEVEGE